MAFGQAIPAEIERRLKGLERQIAVLMREREQNRMTVSENVEIKVTEKTEETTPVKKTRKRRARKKA